VRRPASETTSVWDVRTGRSTTSRWDIQGLRAFAVIAVVLDHLFRWPRGGFVGVDVFFVISGFLITGLLIREHERTGRISFLDFYRRRVKRIMPASLLVLFVGTVASYMAFNSVRANEIRSDSVWAALFGANWRFLTQSTDYFNIDGPISPFQHYWSLSVEEQFYFVWPWLMLLIYAVMLRAAVRSQSTARVVIGAILLVISGTSFAWAVVETADNATRAYFDTFARVWELGVGALLAVAVPVLIKLPRVLRPAMAWLGLVGMTVSLFVVSAETGFPAPAAALPVLSTALVIAAGTFADFREQQRFLFPLTNRLSNYVGDLSYSLYL
jgi:peptidoglycan/LPS O-acetylase OafA/YrhL